MILRNSYQDCRFNNPSVKKWRNKGAYLGIIQMVMLSQIHMNLLRDNALNWFRSDPFNRLSRTANRQFNNSSIVTYHKDHSLWYVTQRGSDLSSYSTDFWRVTSCVLLLLLLLLSGRRYEVTRFIIAVLWHQPYDSYILK